MKILSVWKPFAGAVPAAAKRLLAGDGQPPAGVNLLGRWLRADGSGGWTLIETDNAVSFYEYMASWSDLMAIESTIVVDDDEAGPVLSKLFGS